MVKSKSIKKKKNSSIQDKKTKLKKSKPKTSPKVNEEKNKFKLSEGDILKLEINDLVEDEGICQYKGYILFVKGAKKGDIVKFKVTKIIEKICFAESLDDFSVNKLDIPEVLNNKKSFNELDDLEIPDLPDI